MTATFPCAALQMGAMACYDLLLSPLCISFGPAAAAKPVPGKQHKHKPPAAAAAAARSANAAAAGQAGGSGRQGLGLKFLRLLATAVGVLVYVKARSFLAGDQLVRIYRKVRRRGGGY